MRSAIGIKRSYRAVEALRALWAVQVNQGLERIRAEARIDHRSLERQGQVDQAPTQHMGPGAAAAAAKVEHQQPAAEPLAPVEPVTRIGQHNAEVRERKRVLEAARRLMEPAREWVGELKRAARAGVQTVMGLARGLGASIAAKLRKGYARRRNGSGSRARDRRGRCRRPS